MELGRSFRMGRKFMPLDQASPPSTVPTALADLDDGSRQVMSPTPRALYLNQTLVFDLAFHPQLS